MTPGSGLPTRAEIDRHAGDLTLLNDQLVPLVTAAAGGDLNATDVLLYAIVSQRLAEPGIRRVLVEPDEIDDVVQDVLIVIAESVGNFRGESRFTTWLNGVSRNKALEHVRRKRPSGTPVEPQLTDAQRISSLVTNDVAVQDLLAKLPDAYRKAVTLRDIDGLPYAEIASTLDLNLNTAKAHIARGRAMLALCAAAES